MNVSRPITHVQMVRDHLENIPDFAPPEAFALRWYQPGDEQHWRRIHLAADLHNDITPGLFAQQFGNDARVLAERQAYLLDPSGQPIGTATAWFNADFAGARFGRVHWLAVLPGFQGRGLSKPLMTAVCTRLRELGHDRAYLSTATVCVPAIRLYHQFGFVPLIRNEADAARWRGVPE